MSRLLRWLLQVLGLAAVATALLGCGKFRNAEPLTADRIALAADEAGEFIASREKSDGLKAIKAAPDQEAATEAAAGTRARYVPIWAAYDLFQAAHEAWRTVLNQQGSVPTVVRWAVLSGWCSLATLLDGLGHKLPAILPCDEVTP